MHTSKFRGVTFAQREGRWRANVKATLAGGQTKPVSLGFSASEEQAAARVSAGAYVLGDRCAHSHCVHAEACPRASTAALTPQMVLSRCCAAVQVPHQGALGPLQQPGADARSGVSRTLVGT